MTASKETTSLLSRAAGLKMMANSLTPAQKMADEAGRRTLTLEV